MKRKRRKSTKRARPTRVPLLRYEDAAAARRRAFRRRLVAILLTLMAAKLFVDHLGERVWSGALSLFWQERCFGYRLPEDRLAYVAAPRGTVLPAYLGDFSGSVGSTWRGTVGAAPYPVELAEFQKVTAPTSGVPWDALPGPVFLHGLRDARGCEKLVIVYALADNPAGWWTLVAAVRDPVGVRRAPRRPPVVSTACWPMPRTPVDELAVFAGQPDPADASRFTVRVHLNGRSQWITGVLRDDGTVTFTSSSGLSPWSTNRAGPILVPTALSDRYRSVPRLRATSGLRSASAPTKCTAKHITASTANATAINRRRSRWRIVSDRTAPARGAVIGELNASRTTRRRRSR